MIVSEVYSGILARFKLRDGKPLFLLCRLM